MKIETASRDIAADLTKHGADLAEARGELARLRYDYEQLAARIEKARKVESDALRRRNEAIVTAMKVEGLPVATVAALAGGMNTTAVHNVVARHDA